MRYGKVIIGTNFGDEGKGAEIYSLSAAEHYDLCVRFCGGCNAGHTVQLESGTTHIFGHMGSAYMTNIPTYLGKKFIVNPVLANEERNELQHETLLRPPMYVDNNCLVTTIYDMLLNRAAEEHRGLNRHGSCGVGINETVTRSERFPGHALVVEDLKDYDILRQKIRWIETHYIDDRAIELTGSPLPIETKKIFNVDRFIAECDLFLEHFYTVDVLGMLSSVDNVLFEGSQGLMLDENYKYFPYVTRAKTGIHNIIAMLDESRQSSHSTLDVRYITRPYTTRHGNGPLPFEVKMADLPFDIVDDTNIPNDWQGSLRFAPLHINDMVQAIYDDLRPQYDLVDKRTLVIRCADQVPECDCIPYIEGGLLKESSLSHIVDLLQQRLQHKSKRIWSTCLRYSPYDIASQ